MVPKICSANTSGAPSTKLAERLEMQTAKTETCWIFGASGVRYGKVTAGGRSLLAHRLAWELNNGPIPPGMVVRHKCDVTQCVRPDHLEIGTHADNSNDMTTRNRQAKGERQGSAKLSEQDVLNMRRLAKLGVTRKALAEQFGISTSEASNVILGIKWGHLPEAAPPKMRRLSTAERQVAMSRIEASETHSSIARDLGVSRACISQMALRARRTA